MAVPEQIHPDWQFAFRHLGFNSYAAYLHSELWYSIRKRVLRLKGGWCRCGEPATEVHHLSYDVRTIKGKDLSSLEPICRSCHQAHHEGQELPEPRVRIREVEGKAKGVCRWGEPYWKC